ncbi:MAG: alanyl-tRNA editing protein, partial [Anaerolineae bacterium]
MTVHLYYDDATLREFTARVVEQETRVGEDGKPHPAVKLDQTAFYPTSGGQPHDTGTLEGLRVVDVQEDESGEIWHLLSDPLHPESELVRGRIDWDRRFDHMQQHSGQHLLSAAFEEVLSAHTVGFHLGRETSTIDLDIPELDWEDVFRVEQAANEIVWENRPVTVKIVDETETSNIPLRKPPVVSGEIRVVQIEGYDASACGGTHGYATGEIGIIKVSDIERYKGGVRVTFLCGERALHDYQRTLHLLQVSSVGLSVAAEELPDAIGRLEEEARAARRELRQVRSDLVELEATRLWSRAFVDDGMHVILAHWTDRPFSDARAIASQLREHAKTLALLAVTEERGVRLVCARSDDLPDIDAQTILSDALEPLGGRGGGTPT